MIVYLSIVVSRSRRYREGSYSTKPPRGEDRERRYNTAERERRDRPRDAPRRDRDRYDRHYADYRDIDPSRKYGNLHRERENERRRGQSLTRNTLLYKRILIAR